MNLKDKNFFLFDGAFGTYYSMLYNSDSPCEFANLDHRENVLNIHKEYILAGASAIKTNTFAANTLTLGVEFDAVEEILEAAWDIACEAAKGNELEVFADVGPIHDVFVYLIEQY